MIQQSQRHRSNLKLIILIHFLNSGNKTKRESKQDRLKEKSERNWRVEKVPSNKNFMNLMSNKKMKIMENLKKTRSLSI